MISAYHLLWIIPVATILTAMFTLVTMCMFIVSGDADENSDDYVPKRLKKDA